MIVVTGGEGFIGKNLIKRLEDDGNIGIVSLDTKSMSLDEMYRWLAEHAKDIDCIYHLGAITDTTEMREELFNDYNFGASTFIWNLCALYKIPLIYASSAATYGDGEQGFDDEKPIKGLKPLNPYGWSKQKFDEWVLTTVLRPPFWAGLKFFNVYGHGEAHKGNMASVVYQKYLEIMANEDDVNYSVESDGSFFGALYVNLFKSHRPDYKNGEQLRDFVYVDDVVDVCVWMEKNKPACGMYNVGTGKARTFNDLVHAIFNSLEIKQNIKYVNIPENIRDKYQYFTEAKVFKLRTAGYDKKFHELEEGVEKYICKLKHESR